MRPPRHRLAALTLAATAAFAPAQGPYQTNSAESSLDLGGVQSNGQIPAVTPLCPGTGASLNLASNAPNGMPWDILVSPLAQVTGLPPILSPEIFNVDIFSPSLIFFSSGGPIPAPLVWGGGLSFPVTAPPAPGLVISAQKIIINPLAAVGVKLSQGVTMIINPNGPPIVYASSDDAVISTAIATSPACMPATFPATFSFFGTGYTHLHFSDNGRLCFGGSSPGAGFNSPFANPSSTIPAAGFWSDFNPTISTSTLQLSFTALGDISFGASNLAWHGHPGAISSFSISVNVGTNEILLSGLQGIAANPAGNQKTSGILQGNAQWLGLHPGPGVGSSIQAPFPLGGLSCGSIPLNTARYDYWAGGPGAGPNGQRRLVTLQNAVNQIRFTPGTGSTAYVYSCF